MVVASAAPRGNGETTILTPTDQYSLLLPPNLNGEATNMRDAAEDTKWKTTPHPRVSVFHIRWQTRTDYNRGTHCSIEHIHPSKTTIQCKQHRNQSHCMSNWEWQWRWSKRNRSKLSLYPAKRGNAALTAEHQPQPPQTPANIYHLPNPPQAQLATPQLTQIQEMEYFIRWQLSPNVKMAITQLWTLKTTTWFKTQIYIYLHNLGKTSFNNLFQLNTNELKMPSLLQHLEQPWYHHNYDKSRGPCNIF